MPDYPRGFRKHGNFVAVAKRLPKVWDGNADMVSARAQVVASIPGMEPKRFFLVHASQVQGNTLLVPSRHFTIDRSPIGVIFVELLAGTNTLIDSLVPVAGQIVSHTTFEDGQRVGKTRQVRVNHSCTIVTSRASALDRTLTASRSSSSGTGFENLRLTATMSSGSVESPTSEQTRPRVLWGLDPDRLVRNAYAQVEDLALVTADYFLMHLDILLIDSHKVAARLESRPLTITSDTHLAFLHHFFSTEGAPYYSWPPPKCEAGSLFSSPTIGEAQTIALTLYVLWRGQRDNGLPTQRKALLAMPGIATLITSAAVRLRRYLYVQLIAIPNASKEKDAVIARIKKSHTQSILVDQAHADLVDHFERNVRPGTPWQAPYQFEDGRFWIRGEEVDPGHVGHVFITVQLAGELPEASRERATPMVVNDRLRVRIDEAALLYDALCIFQRHILEDAAVLCAQQALGGLRLPSPLTEIAGEVMSLYEVAAKEFASRTPHRMLAALQGMTSGLQHAAMYYDSYCIRHKEDLGVTLAAAHLKRSRSTYGRLAVDDNYQDIAQHVPDIESLTEFMPPCMSNVVKRAQNPSTHLKDRDRLIMKGYMKALGYDGADAQRYLRTPPLYSGVPTVENGYRSSMACRRIVNDRGADGRTIACPYRKTSLRSDERVGDACGAACLAAGGLAGRSGLTHPLQFIERQIMKRNHEA